MQDGVISSMVSSWSELLQSANMAASLTGEMLDWVRHTLKSCPARADHAGPGQAKADRLSTVCSSPLELWGLAAVLSQLAAESREAVQAAAYEAAKAVGWIHRRSTVWVHSSPSKITNLKIQSNVCISSTHCYSGKTMICSTLEQRTACCFRPREWLPWGGWARVVHLLYENKMQLAAAPAACSTQNTHIKVFLSQDSINGSKSSCQ